MSNLKEALFLTKNFGWSIIPIASGTKKPLIDWKAYQTKRATPEEIISWFKKWEDASLAVVTGRISNVIIVDIDPKNGGLRKPFAKIATVRTKTGGDGEHLYFHYEKNIPNSTGIKPGIDIRGEGGYALLPPSIHQSGNYYEWILSPHSGTPILPLPDFVKDWLKQRKPLGESNWQPEILLGVEEGKRNDSAASVIGKLLTRFPKEEWESEVWLLVNAWNKTNRSPLSSEELRQVFDSIAKKETLRLQTYSIQPEESLEEIMVETNQGMSLVTWDEFVVQEETENEKWIIPNLLRRSWLAVLGGHGKHGKTTLAVHLLNSLRNGTDFINKCEAVPVIYINCEMGIADTRDLLKNVSENYPPEGKEAFITNQPPLPLNLDALEKILGNQTEKGVCLIDSFRAAFCLREDFENQAGTVGHILRKLQIIGRKTGWTILLIHHSRKSGTGEILDLAGSGEWSSAPDVIFTWHSPNSREPGTLNAGGRIPPFESRSIRLSREKLEFLGTVEEQSAAAERQTIFEALNEEDWISTDEVAKATGIPPSTVRRRLIELFPQVARTGEGKRGNPHLWKVQKNDK